MPQQVGHMFLLIYLMIICSNLGLQGMGVEAVDPGDSMALLRCVVLCVVKLIVCCYFESRLNLSPTREYGVIQAHLQLEGEIADFMEVDSAISYSESAATGTLSFN